MKNLVTTIVLVLFSIASFAQKKGYDIEVKFKQPIADEYIYLAKYYAKPLPNIWKVDSVKADKKGVFHFKNKDEIIGGIYMVLFNKNAKWMDIIMDNGLKTSITIDTVNVLKNAVITGSEENIINQQFQLKAEKYGKNAQALKQEYATAKNKKDSTAIDEKIITLNKTYKSERDALIKAHPNYLLSKILKAVEVPEAPKGTHYLEDGKTVDSFYAYRYVKAHYWDNFDFTDDRLINTPIYDGKLKDYFDNYIYQIPDSVKYELDEILTKTKPSKELFKYTLHTMGNYVRTSKVMGMDEVFVHLVENYFMKGDAYWLDSTDLAKYYIEPAQKIAPNVIGNQAPELILKDAYSLQPVSLDDIKAKYTLLIFWSPDCGHCQKEIPAIDSLYVNELKQKDIKVFSVIIPESGELSDVHKAVDKFNIKEWENAIDTDGSSKFRSKYNVYTTPVLYLLDENKKIVGKNLSHESIPKLLEFLEKKAVH